MIALVTGGLGFIGSHVVDMLLEKGHTVYVVDNLSTGDERNKNGLATYEIKDIRDTKWLTSFIASIRPDWVFHLAALSRIQPSFEDPEGHDDVNVRGTLALIKAVSDQPGMRAFIYSSSSSVYGNPSIFPTSEEASINPLSPYALQKYTAERYLHILATRLRFDAVSLRYFNPYGPRSLNPANRYNAYSSVVGIFQEQKSRGVPLTITGDGSQERDFVHVRDVAKATILVAEKIEQSKGHVFNVGCGKKISILELAKLYESKYEFVPSRHGEARITLANIEKIKKLGWHPDISLVETIQSGGA